MTQLTDENYATIQGMIISLARFYGPGGKASKESYARATKEVAITAGTTEEELTAYLAGQRNRARWANAAQDKLLVHGELLDNNQEERVEMENLLRERLQVVGPMCGYQFDFKNKRLTLMALQLLPRVCLSLWGTLRIKNHQVYTLNHERNRVTVWRKV